VPAGPTPKVMSCSWMCFQVFNLARRATMQLGVARDQLRAVDRALGAARNAAHRGVEKFDQAELDFVDRQRRPGHCVEMPERVGGQPGLFTQNRESLVAATNHHVEAGFDLPDIFIEWPAQLGQLGIVDRRQGQFDRPLLGRGLSLLG
jgi:hypothetical protein